MKFSVAGGRVRRWAALAALAWAGCSGASDAPTFGDLALPTVASSEAVPLARCPTPKCLTVYVAPWCPYCRASGPLIRALREHLKGQNVTTRVVVGLDQADKVDAYAREFGPETLLDGAGSLQIAGVPHFFVSDARGRIVRDVSGAPMPTVPPPWGPEILKEVESQIGI